MGTVLKHPVLDRVKPSFLIFDIWALLCPDYKFLRFSCFEKIGRTGRTDRQTDGQTDGRGVTLDAVP